MPSNGLTTLRYGLTEVRSLITVRMAKAGRRVYVVGDSHARVFRGRRGIYVAHIGAITLHRAAREGEAVRLLHHGLRWKLMPRRLQRQLSYRANRDAIVLSFGEIDCRNHVLTQSARRSVDPLVIVDELIRDAVKVTLAIQSHTGCPVLFLQIPPPSHTGGNESYPILGSPAERVEWHRRFNTGIARELSALDSVGVVRLGNAYEDERGMLHVKCSDGGLHFGKHLSGELSVKVREAAMRLATG